MAAPSKAQHLTDVHALLKRHYTREPRTARLTVLEAVVYGICHEDATRRQADRALARFKDEFFDWNEVRVSSVPEIQGILAELPEPEARARRARRFLRQLFIKTYSFSLDHLVKKPQKEAVKALHDFEALRVDFILATVIQQALGGHAIPIDASMRRALERLGIAEPGTDDHALRSTLERLVPKTRGSEFVDLMEELAHDTCVAGEPNCAACAVRKLCPTGQARVTADKAAARASARASSKTGTARTASTEIAAAPEPARASTAASPAKPVAARKKSAIANNEPRTPTPTRASRKSPPRKK